eukprot:6543067-Prorocentrum_lima.AAC.1
MGWAWRKAWPRPSPRVEAASTRYTTLFASTAVAPSSASKFDDALELLLDPIVGSPARGKK